MREYLKGLGLDQETIDSIMAEHGKLMTQNTEKITALTAENTALKNENTELKKYDGAALQQKVDDLEKEKNDLIANHKKELSDKEFESALQLGIAKSGTIDPTALMAHVDKTKLSINEQNELVGWNEQLDALKGSYGYLFNQSATGEPHGGTSETGDQKASLTEALTDHYR